MMNRQIRLCCILINAFAAFVHAADWPLYRADASRSGYSPDTQRPILNDRTIYAFPTAIDLLTGEQRDLTMTKSYGCGILGASQTLLVFRSATIGYIDRSSPTRTENYGRIRPGCWINTIPAGGLVLLAEAASGCECSYLNQATMALHPRE